MIYILGDIYENFNIVKIVLIVKIASKDGAYSYWAF